MTTGLLKGLSRLPDLQLETLVSKSSLRLPDASRERVLPWRTDRAIRRLLTDHFHALTSSDADVFFYPKGFLGLIRPPFGKSVVTIHDMIVQHYADFYPGERSSLNYRYWLELTKHTLRSADLVLTVSQTSKEQILNFCARYRLPVPRIEIVYEATDFEQLQFPEKAAKEDYVLLLASKEPHKRTLDTLRFWNRWQDRLPELLLVGPLPEEAEQLLQCSTSCKHSPFLQREDFVDVIRKARGLIFPSEIEGFGLPALESYYLETPVCVARGTAMDEILGEATQRGRFDLNDEVSMANAIKDILDMPAAEVEEAGSKLRKRYSSEKFVNSVAESFEAALSS